MEIPVINRITKIELETGLTSFPKSNLPSFSLSPLEYLSLSTPNHYLKWGALFIALLASFTGIINRIKILMITLKRPRNSLSEPILRNLDEEDDELSSALSNSWSGFEGEEEDDLPSSSRNLELTDRDFHVRGDNVRPLENVEYRDRDRNRDQFSLSDFDSGKAVVKLWDEVRFGLDESDEGSVISAVFDVRKEEMIANSVSGWRSEVAAKAVNVSASPTAIVLSPGKDVKGNVLLTLWDARMGYKMPAIIAEWKAVR